MPGTLVLLPNTLGAPVADGLAPAVGDWVRKLDGLIAESDRGGRRYLEQFQGLKKPPQQIPIAVFGEHQAKDDMTWFLEPCLRGETWGFVSDAGMPCIADPGSALVRRCRQLNIEVVALSGPSAPLLALLLSGLSSQQFIFEGYAPRDPEGRAEWIHRVGSESITHICIEAPYRNRALLEALITHLPPDSQLCVALDLTLPTQQVLVGSVATWGSGPEDIDDRPAVFVFFPLDRRNVMPSAPTGPARRPPGHGGRGRGR